jgi:hypothetical protein
VTLGLRDVELEVLRQEWLAYPAAASL